jgi:hypothetical protein
MGYGQNGKHEIIAQFLGDKHMCWKRKQGLNKTNTPT